MELKELWKLGYQDLKPIMIELAKKPEYTALAARYMEGGSPGVVAEFKGPPAKLYGISHYHSDDREEKKKAFWTRIFGE
jgi:hypothetical protein